MVAVISPINGGIPAMKCVRVWFVLFVAVLLAASSAGASRPGEATPLTDPGGAKAFGLPIHLTEEEMTRLDEIGLFHLTTAAPPGPVRKCAQWGPATGVLIAFEGGFGLPLDLITEFSEDVTVHVLCRPNQVNACSNALEKGGVNMANVDLIGVPLNSIWTRDYGPQDVFAGGDYGIVDHIYNRPRPDDDQVPWELGTLWGCTVYGMDLIFTGGNFMPDGHGKAFSTDLVWDENPSMSHEEIAQMLEDYMGIADYVVVPDITSSGIHHIDCWAKLLNEETIMVQEVAPSHPFYGELEARVATFGTLTNCYGRPYDIVRVFCESIGGDDVACYTNALTLNDKVFVPTYGVSSDSAALAAYEAAMPGYEVLGYANGWLSDDAIRCRAMEIHDRYMLVVDTNPLQDMEINATEYRVTAFIDDRSEAGLVADSLLVYWRLEGLPDFTPIVMQTTADPDSYYADIPGQADSVNVEYYASAVDSSGRHSTRPIVAPGAWYTFNTGRTSSSVADGKEPSAPTGFRLAQNSPNPFRPNTEIRYNLPVDCHVSLQVYDVAGKHVVTLVDEYQPAGTKLVRWDGRDGGGSRTPSGIYFYRLESGSYIDIKKMAIVR